MKQSLEKLSEESSETSVLPTKTTWIEKVKLNFLNGPEVPSLKPLGGSNVDSAFRPFKVNEMSTRIAWGLNGKK